MVAFASVPLAELEPLKRGFATRVTINDLVLAATAGGLRRWLEHCDAPLRAMRVKVPVSLHGPGELGEALGNADSCFFVDLPVTEPDATQRLLAIAAECGARKRAGDAQQLDAVLREIAAHSPAAGRAAVHWTMSPHVFTLNVRMRARPQARTAPVRPSRPLRLCARRGRRLARAADRRVLRLRGTLTFGLCGDAEHVRAIDTLAREIEGEFTALARQRTTV